MENALEMKQVCKYFAGVRANYNVDLTVRAGEVHALLGENGAGKSTLMNILYGLYEPTSGEIWLNGEQVTISSPQHAIKLGVGMVHQHFMLIPALTVVENVVLGMKGAKSPRIDLEAAAKELTALAAQYKMEIDPMAKVSTLSVGQQQRLEILKALYRGAKLFIFDEPTAVLTPQEVEELFNMFRKLTAEGKTIIFISHKLHEVMSICDRCTVLRLGELAATVDIKDTTRQELAKLMVGKEVSLKYDKAVQDPQKQRDVLCVEHLETMSSKGIKALTDLSLTIKSGEILGIAGIDGNGQSELVDCITGLRPISGGKVTIDGKDLTGAHPRTVLDNGVSHIPADRLARGVVMPMNLSENVLLMNAEDKAFSKGLFLNWQHIDAYTDKIIGDYHVKTPGHNELMQNLSGGNQQKVVLGREIMRDPKLLIAMHPARGLDIGATQFIQQTIVDERDRGAAVLLVSTELEEIQALSDRIAVMYEGKIMGIVPPTTPIHELGMMMAGMHASELATAQ